MTSQLPDNPSEAFAPDRYYATKTAAERLAVGENTIRDALAKGDLKAIKAGGRVRIRGKELNSWLRPYA